MLAPPLLVSYKSADDYLSALPTTLKNDYEDEIRTLVKSGLPPVVSTRCLAILFGFSTEFIISMITSNKKYYREFTIPKGKKSRKIHAPKVSLKVIQKWFGFHLSESITLDDSVYGFVKGQSTVKAAKMHCEANWMYSVDIEDFFPSTTEEVIKTSLLDVGYSEKGADIIAPLCCYMDRLAQGAPSSPVLSNLALSPIDKKLNALANEFGITFTRYADDIVFSGREDFPEEIKKRVKSLFEGTCWKLSDKKEHFADAKRGQRLKVHGLLVHGHKPRLTKGYRNKIRAYEHLLKSGKIKDKDIARIRGHINYSNSVEDLEE